MGGLYCPETEHDACGVGFVVHIGGRKSRDIVDQGLQVLRRLSHRGATGSDPNTGDGAGILLQLPHRFFKREGLALGFDMPRRRRYGVGMVFLPREPEQRRVCETIFAQVIEEEGQRLLGWRDVPIDPDHCGDLARSVLPTIRQIYIARRRLVPSAFERKLYIIRKLVENRVRHSGSDPDDRFHVASLSADTIVYKGLLLPKQLANFYGDLREPDMVSAIAIVHSRFSTNTFPTWDLAQPFHRIAHNGEINTVRGNRNWMSARRSQLQSAKFGGSLDRLFPIIVPGKSDSAQFDNMLELLHLGGRSLPHAIMMMIPEAWQNDPLMDRERADFYRYSSALLEPWDGPAAIVFTDGRIVGATLDRNGLRPARYTITDDNMLILASEVGVTDVAPERVRSKGRLRPGRMLLVDTEQGEIVDDDRIKREIAGRWPYGSWLRKNVFTTEQFPDVECVPPLVGESLLQQQRAFGYTMEDVRLLVGPMVETGSEPVGSMGTDTPLAVLSDWAPPLFRYFHQLFAQVTNPPIDPIREALVMSLETNIGPDGNPFDETPEQCHRLRMPGPILLNETLAKVISIHEGAFEPITLSLKWPLADGPAGLAKAVDALCTSTEEAIDEGFNIIVLSDRGVDNEHVAIPSLLALSAVHQHLVRVGTRMQAGVVVETAEAREVHDFALLIGFGAAAVNPYLALDTIEEMIDSNAISVPEGQKPGIRYCKSINKGLLKIMAKMGISTLQSYRGAQIFEAVGLNQELVNRHFTGTSSRLQGLGMEELAREVIERHDLGFGRNRVAISEELPVGGEYQWRRRGEVHKWNPSTIATLQTATRTNDAKVFERYSGLVDDEDRVLCTLRGLLEINTSSQESIPLDSVEPATTIVQRFVSGAMSFGSISAEAHETLAIAMNRIGARSNSGEGGEETHRFLPDENGDLRRSAIKQVASGRFGVTAYYLVNADDIQIKMAQGAKPGEGGQLPGHKVDERIARVRCSTPGVSLISPPPHHDIYSIEDLAQLIYDLQSVNPRARISVKLVSEVGVGTIAAGVAKAGAGAIVIAGYTGGTGAAALSSIKHAGLPWELGLAEAQQVLVMNDLRARVRLQVDGGMRTGRDVIVAGLMGADEFGMATASLIAAGCIMLRKCHLNTCSVGIATQDPELRERFTGKPEHIINFFMLVAEEVRQFLAQLGFKTFGALIGRADLLSVKHTDHWKAKLLDLSPLLAVDSSRSHKTSCSTPHRNPLMDHLDRELIQRAAPAIQKGERTEIAMSIRNTDRAVGAMLSGVVVETHGAAGLSDDTIHIGLIGSAGQSFGAFLAKGITLELEGETNDYVGKGLSGGRIIIYPPNASTFAPEENFVVGNTVLYGATSGELYACGLAGERFAVRNSGARAVIEGVGDHGCEYMTGGAVVVLGKTGRNFAAGMSGGVAYVFEREHTFRPLCNLEMVELESLSDESEVWMVYGMIESHVRFTGSPLGNRILDNWELMVPQFVKVMPVDYKRVLAERRAARRGPPKLSVVRGIT